MSKSKAKPLPTTIQMSFFRLTAFLPFIANLATTSHTIMVVSNTSDRGHSAANPTQQCRIVAAIPSVLSRGL